MKHRYLTFDCYGTLIDWRKGVEEALVRLLGEGVLRGSGLMGVYVEAEKREQGAYKKYREVLRDSAVRVGESLGARVGREQAVAFASSLPGWPAFPDTSAALRGFGRLGYERYILSNVDTDLLEETIKVADLEVDGYITAEETRSYKPAHGHWESFMKKTGATRGEVLHVAQSIFHDIVPTQEMGIPSAWVNRYRERIPVEVHPEYVTESLGELVALLG